MASTVDSRGREYLLAMQADAQAERNTTAQVEHYQAMGVGLAAFCVAMYRTLVEDKTFTAAQSLELVGRAVQGR